jgi:branched-chain amino acid transport system permease protein
MTAASGLAVDKAARPPVHWAPLLKDAALAALVAVLLALPLVGLQTYDIGGGALGVRTHFDWVAVGAAAVFAGRLVLRLYPQLYGGRAASRPTPFSRLAVWANRQVLAITLAGIAFGVALPFLPFSSRYLIDLGTTVLIYVMLGWGLNVVVGLAGLLDLGYVAFYAVGAYTFALLARDLNFTFWEALPFSGLVAASFGVLLGFPVLRLSGEYLAIVTVGFGEIIRIVLLNWSPVTGGPNGSRRSAAVILWVAVCRAAPRGITTFHQFFGLEFSPDHRVTFLYFVILALALVTNLFTLRIRKLPLGRAWEHCAKTGACRALASTRPMSNSPPLPSAQCSGVSPGAFSRPGKDLSARRVSPSSSRRRSWPSSCSAAWGARWVLCSPRSCWSRYRNSAAPLPSSAC